MAYTKAMKRTNPETEKRVLTFALLGYPYPDIAEKTGVAISTIKKIRARNKGAAGVDVLKLEHTYIDEALAIQQRARRQLKRILDEAEGGIRKLTIGELIRIAKYGDKAVDPREPRKTVYDHQREVEKLLELIDKK